MTLLVKIDNKDDEKFVRKLLMRLGFPFKTISDETMGDLAFGAILKKNKKKNVVSLNQAKRIYRNLIRKKNQEKAK